MFAIRDYNLFLYEQDKLTRVCLSVLVFQKRTSRHMFLFCSYFKSALFTDN